ncbi:MAG: hypothetical protein RLZZ526_1242 [Actinomycetota bacterium]|jgi:hypothetical protein
MIAVQFLPVLFTVLAIMSGTTLLVLVYFDNRNSRIDDSIAAFRRHIDALSPEARRMSASRADDDNRRR